MTVSAVDGCVCSQGRKGHFVKKETSNLIPKISIHQIQIPVICIYYEPINKLMLNKQAKKRKNVHCPAGHSAIS